MDSCAFVIETEPRSGWGQRDETGGHGAGARPRAEVRRAPPRKDMGQEPSGHRLHVHVFDPVSSTMIYSDLLNRGPGDHPQQTDLMVELERENDGPGFGAPGKNNQKRVRCVL